MRIRTYQIALGAALVVCAALAAATGYLLLHRRPARTAIRSTDMNPVIASGPEAPAKASPEAESAPAMEPTLAPVQLSPQRMQQIGVTTAIAERKIVNDELQAPGTVDIDEQKLSYVQTRFPGWIQAVFANATYQYVRKGEPLFTVYSPDLVSSEQEYLLARKSQAAFSQPMEGQEMHAVASQESGWLVQAAEQRLEQFGVAPEEIANLEKTGKVEKNLTMYSPTSGYITERNALPNAYVQPEMRLYTIADLSTVWVYANVSQDDVGRLRPGDPARVTVDAYPGRRFGARIDQILPQVDQATRTVKVRLIMANPALALKPGMYVNVDIAASLGRQLVVPASAILQSGERAVAFIDHGDGNLEPRVVTTGPQVDRNVVVLSGLKAGERVVSSANFLVDSEAQLQAAFQNFAPPMQSATAAGNSMKDQLQIAFTTRPSPPQKGDNTLRVQLTGADGKPAGGTQVTVSFFMAAMPAMGMAAEHVSAVLAEKNGGSYEGPLRLPSGGTWQVTITVRRNGEVVATRQLSVDATGGM
ncbi:MAG TPA: FixH family protein [Terracidiphilus sp.]|nr:FixH family protein [Terracidiphilus sp.]